MNNSFFKNNMYYDYENRGMDNSNLFSADEAFIKGNLFSDLYDGYENYRPSNLITSNEKDKLYFEIMKIAFLKHELNLYLDLHPNDSSMITLFNDYRNKEMMLVKKYEDLYGAINLRSDVLNNEPFNWVQSNWPWLLEDKNYV